MPNIQNLRKQAKQILRWHQERHYPVAAVIRTYSPRFQRLSDPEVLDQPFKLMDAQEVVARREGFDSWLALTMGVEPMINEPVQQTLRPSVIASEPQLFAADIATSCRYFESVLGFKIAFAYGEPPSYAQVVRDGAGLNLRKVDQPLIDPELRDREDFLSASITVKYIKQLFLEFQESGADFHRPLHTEPWGAHTFIVKDRDGNLILFAE